MDLIPKNSPVVNEKQWKSKLELLMRSFNVIKEEKFSFRRRAMNINF